MENSGRAIGFAAIITALVGAGTLLLAVYDRMDRRTVADSQPIERMLDARIQAAPQTAQEPRIDPQDLAPLDPAPLEPVLLDPALQDPEPLQTKSSPFASSVPALATPSFSCDMPTSSYQAYELAICNSPDLSLADQSLQAAYLAARQRGNQSQNAALKRAQFSWMKSRIRCADNACLLALYRQRLSEVEQSNR